MPPPIHNPNPAIIMPPVRNPNPPMPPQPYIQPFNPYPVNPSVLPPGIVPRVPPPTGKQCAACHQPKSDNQFYYQVRCPEHSDLVCYRCIQASGSKNCPKCQREFSGNEVTYMPTYIKSANPLQ
jgi:hypothetical protein